jgi:drug/metabolite transporter (DMT)-like permease
MGASKQNATVLPVISLLITATLWGTVWYPLRLLEQHGLTGLWASLVCYGTAMVVGVPILWRWRGEVVAHPLLLACMGLAAGWCNVTFILAVLQGTVVRVLLLFYLSPIWAVVLGWLLLGERPDRPALVVFCLALLGAVVMLYDSHTGVPWPRERADWLAVSAGFTFALSNVFVRKLQGVGIGVKSAATWAGVVGVAGLWLTLDRAPLPGAGMEVLMAAVALGLAGFVVMTLTVQYGVTHMPVHRSAVILLFELVVGAVSSLLLTEETVLPREWAGGTMIVAASWLAARLHVGDVA